MLVSYTQTQMVYDWEESQFSKYYGNHITVHECNRFVGMVWGSFGLGSLRVPLVTDGRGSPHARAYPSIIHLPKWGRNYNILSHELSHCLTSLLDHDDNYAHGGIFLHVYFTILSRFLGFKYRKLVSKAEASGLHVHRVCLKRRLLKVVA